MTQKAITFFILALTASSILAGAASLVTSSKVILVLLYSLGVGIATLVYKGKAPMERGKYTAYWLLAAIALPVIYMGVVHIIGRYFFGYPIEPLALTPYFYGTIPFILLASWLEEIGWRGYLFNVFEKASWMRMNMTVGVLWSCWHLPAIITGSYAVTPPLLLGIALFTLNVILLSFLFAWFRQKTGGIMVVTMLHACHNLAYTYWKGEEAHMLLSESGLILTAVLLALMGALRAWKRPVPA